MGVLITVAIPYITHFIRYNNMDIVSWALTFVGIVLFIGSAIGLLYENSNVKALIRQLQQGQDKSDGDEEEDEKEEKKE